MSRVPQDRPAKSGDVALAGPDGRRLTDLIRAAEAKGVEALNSIMNVALYRLLLQGSGAVVSSKFLWSPEERAKLTSVFASIISTGDLLGRGRVMEKMNKAQTGGRLFRFAETETPLAFIPTDELPILPPQEAITYFRTLIPRLGIDPIRWAPVMNRTAFTLAAATEHTLLNKIQELILGRLRSGENFGTAPKEIESLIASLGVTPKNPQYAQMVFRTNVMDSYNVGQGLAIAQDPELGDFFPVWQYLGIRDGREGDDHRPRFDRYYPSSVHFAEVRGKRVFNCRCTSNYIDRYQWADLESRGARMETSWHPIAA